MSDDTVKGYARALQDFETLVRQTHGPQPDIIAGFEDGKNELGDDKRAAKDAHYYLGLSLGRLLVMLKIKFRNV